MNTQRISILIGTASMLLLLVSCSTSQNPPQTSRNSGVPASPGRDMKDMNPEECVSQLTTHLELTIEQQEQLRPIIEESLAQRHALLEEARSQGRSGMSEMRKKIQQLQIDTEYRLAEFLTDIQLEEYRQMTEKQQQQLENMRGQRSAGGRGGRSGKGGF